MPSIPWLSRSQSITSQALLNALQDHFDRVREIACDVKVLAPATSVVNVSVKLWAREDRSFETVAEAARSAALPEDPAEISPGGRRAGGPMSETAPVEPVPARFLGDGLGKIVTGPHGAPLLRRPGAGDMELTALKAPKAQDGTEEGGKTQSPPASQGGLEGLYRQAVQAARPAAQALAVPQRDQTVRPEEPEVPRQLTVDELDRAVRRDSRRYDGGLEIF